METTRQAKISRLLQKELSEIFRQQTAKTHGVIASVSAVRVTPDLSIARAYLSVFPSEKSAEMIENINSSARTIRYELAQKVRFQLRKVPELQFYLDDSLDYVANIDSAYLFLISSESSESLRISCRMAAISFNKTP